MTTDEPAVRPGRMTETDILAFDGSTATAKSDAIVVEEPLELRVSAGRETRTLAVTMRTPGNDFELAAGFAIGEAIVNKREDVAGIAYCLDAELEPDQRYNVVTIALAGASLPGLQRLERHFLTSSACGVCGRAQLDALRESGVSPLDDGVTLASDVLYSLPERMRAAQRVFESTGGLHAAALFAPDGTLLALREDVGRHNAVDKIVGWALMANRLPLSGTALMVSGRAGYEIVQKAAVARIPIVCSVSAPSTLAVDVARAFNVTLAGFVRDRRANVYNGGFRIEPHP